MADLPPLYPADPGSPFTTLAGPYTTGDTTVTLTDASTRPAAPNLLCLEGAGGSCVLLYTGIDGNTLTGISQIEGPTGTWPAGSYAYRGFAAYDHDALLEHLFALEAADPLPEGVQGCIIYHNGSAWVVLNAGTDGQVLQTRGAGANPAWADPVAPLPAGTFGDTLFHDGTDWVARSSAPIIGIEWDTTSTSPALTWIDELGNPITSLPPGFFDSHPVWGGRWRCTRDRTTGQITFGSNARGDGLTLDGTAGDVLVREPAFWAKHEYDPGEGLVRWWVSPRPSTGFALHPYFYMRGGGFPAANMFCGAYESYGYLDAGTFKLGSATGKTPVTGAVAYPDLPNSGRLTIDDAELYAQNAGMSGITSFWGDCARMLLMYIEYGTFDIQTALGAGVVDMASGSGFAGVNTGVDSIDSRLAENGTGVGSGTDGLTPVCWRGIENPYGNVWKFVIGANFSNDGTYRLIKRDGTGTLAGTLAAGSYESGSGVPIVDGSISALLQGDLEGLAFVPSAAAGSTATYLCDNWWCPRGANYILRAGGPWLDARRAGPGYRHTNALVSYSNRTIGARVEFRPSQGV